MSEMSLLPSPRSVEPAKHRRIPKRVSSHDAKEIGKQLQAGSKYIVYFVKCELLGHSYEDLKREAEKFLPHRDEPPSWLYPAYKANSVYYVGQTATLGTRIAAHACYLHTGEDAPDNPSELTAVSVPKSVGVIARVGDRETAKSIESEQANKWRGRKGRFVYYA
jgi:hypothetical protein